MFAIVALQIKVRLDRSMYLNVIVIADIIELIDKKVLIDSVIKFVRKIDHFNLMATNNLVMVMVIPSDLVS